MFIVTSYDMNNWIVKMRTSQRLLIKCTIQYSGRFLWHIWWIHEREEKIPQFIIIKFGQWNTHSWLQKFVLYPLFGSTSKKKNIKKWNKSQWNMLLTCIRYAQCKIENFNNRMKRKKLKIDVETKKKILVHQSIWKIYSKTAI